jgi:C4-dicarboxylate transporter, DctM subunit
MKWELGIPALILGGLATGLTEIDESAAFAAAYVIFIEIYIYKDLTWKDVPRIVGNSIALAGAVILIMAAAQALTNYIISEQIPDAIFEWVTSAGVTKPWHFLITLNVFLYILGAVMDGFSSILVAVPLLIPFAAEFQMSPFHLAIMFLLNLEIAYLSPPLGQNLFVTAFRFNVPMVRLFRVCVPFMVLMTIGLIVLMVFPSLSTVSVQGDIRKSRALSAAQNERPRESWMMECVQEDRNNPLPCSAEDMKKFGKQQAEPVENGGDVPEKPSTGDVPPTGTDDEDAEDEKLMKEMMGDDEAGDAAAAGDAGKSAPKKETEEEEDERLMKEMMK